MIWIGLLTTPQESGWLSCVVTLHFGPEELMNWFHCTMPAFSLACGGTTRVAVAVIG